MNNCDFPAESNAHHPTRQLYFMQRNTPLTTGPMFQVSQVDYARKVPFSIVCKQQTILAVLFAPHLSTKKAATRVYTPQYTR